MWREIDSDVYGKVMGTLFIAAAACTAAGLLALARPANRHRWVYLTALILLSIGAPMFAVLPWLGDDPPSTYVRTIGVVLIAFAAFAVTVPVLHWIDRAAREVPAQPVRFCPYCGGSSVVPDQAAFTCQRCATEFTVAPRRTIPTR
jgi:peptidoglycan/LPS O-acetylase OafA/YrhL